jgi:pyroglutamyl-peptidase
LLTGFDPFGGDALNPSWLLAERLAGQVIAGHPVVAEQLSTVFADAPARLRAALIRHRPVLAVALGLAAGRAAISLERVAINLIDARIPDNAGAQPVDAPVSAHGPAAYFSTLPIKAMRAAMLAADAPAEISQTAGTFVCNQVFYALMQALAGDAGLAATRGGFIHRPLLPAQGWPSVPLDVMARGLRAGLTAAIKHPVDLRETGGAIS